MLDDGETPAGLMRVDEKAIPNARLGAQSLAFERTDNAVESHTTNISKPLDGVDSTKVVFLWPE